MSIFREVKVTIWVADGVTNRRIDGAAGASRPDAGVRNDRIATETPIALTYNRVSHVVMMATPADLEDFALGFSLTEGLIGGVGDLLATRVIPREGGIEVAITITDDWFDRLTHGLRPLRRGNHRAGPALPAAGRPLDSRQQRRAAECHRPPGAAPAAAG
jgi:formate dehydrogenase assembly factor FdhD